MGDETVRLVDTQTHVSEGSKSTHSLHKSRKTTAIVLQEFTRTMGIDYVWPQTDINITYLPLSDPLCANTTCIAFNAAYNASQTLISWDSQFSYGYYTVYFWGCVLGIFALVACAQRLDYYHASRSSGYFAGDHPTSGDKIIAIGRIVTYRRLSGRLAEWLRMSSFGLTILVLSSFLFAILLCFIQHPYYRHDRGYGSPPLGVRAGLAGVAMTPITFGLSGKYNLVTLLTGISHERLNFMHRWCGMIYLFLGLVHTVPFLINDSNRMSGGAKRLCYQFYYHGSQEYSGIAPLAVLVFLCTFSIPTFRHKFYEIFVHTHIAAAVAFLGTMFWHAQDAGDSWAYLWATVAIWLTQLAARAWSKTAMFEAFGGKRERDGMAHVTALTDRTGGAVMLRIVVQSQLSWTPGQHVFLRLPKLGILDNHPFTIASVPSARNTKDEPEHPINELVFLVRPHQGVTKKILEYTTQQDSADAEKGDLCIPPLQTHSKATTSLNVRIDGPYGGLEGHAVMHKLYDHAILVAGGGGISAILPWVISLSRSVGDVNELCRLQKISLIWCIRHASAQSWAEDELRECLNLAGSALEIDIFVTGARDDRDASGASFASLQDNDGLQTKGAEIDVDSAGQQDKETGSGSEKAIPAIRVHSERPYLPSHLEHLVSLRRTMILCCGPESLKIDLSNAAAYLQSKVLGNQVDEVALHTETFGW